MKLTIIFVTFFLMSIAFGQRNEDENCQPPCDCSEKIILPEVPVDDLMDAMGKTKWGHLDYLNPNSPEKVAVKDIMLIYQKPGTTISFCGESAASFVRATKSWAKVIERDKHLTINEGCSKAGGAFVVKILSVQDPDPVKRREAQFACRDKKVNIAAFDPDTGNLLLCHRLYDSYLDDLDAIILHEVGHLWGLCDQYKNMYGITNCDHNFKSLRNEGAVMSNSGIEKLTLDDEYGLKLLTCREFKIGNWWKRVDINKLWEKKVDRFEECDDL